MSLPALDPLVCDTYRPPCAALSVRTAIGEVTVPASASLTIGWAVAGGAVVGGAVVGGAVVGGAGVVTGAAADAGDVFPAASRATTV